MAYFVFAQHGLAMLKIFALSKEKTEVKTNRHIYKLMHQAGNGVLVSKATTSVDTCCIGQVGHSLQYPGFLEGFPQVFVLS